MAVLEGGIAYSPTYELINSSEISTSVQQFAVDWYPPSLNAQNQPGAEGSLTNNLPLQIVTWSINAGSYQKTWFDDFYYRIHLEYYYLNLGNILTEQINFVIIWNAWFVNKTLSSVTENNLTDLDISLPVSLPYDFKALEEVQAQIVAGNIGSAQINGNFYFNFPGQIVTLDVIGQRVILWPFAPQNSINETKEFLTDIIKCRGGESRYALREIPRSTISYNYIFREVDEFSLAKTLARGFTNSTYGVPLWTDYISLSNLSQGQTVIPVATANYEFEVNSIVVFWKNYNYYSIGEIFSKTSTQIILKDGLSLDFSQCWMFPVKIGWPNNGISLDRNDNHAKTAQISFFMLDNMYQAIWSPELYRSLPVLTTTTVVTGGLTDNYYRENERFDSETGIFMQFDKENYTRSRQQISIKVHTRADLYNLRRFIDYLRGRYQAFWVCSFNEDCGIYDSTLAQGNNSLTVVNGFWESYTFFEPTTRYVRIFGRNSSGDIITQNFQVIGAVNNNDGTEDLAFSENATQDITNIFRISLLTKVRLESDTVMFEHSPRNCVSLKADVVEVLA